MAKHTSGPWKHGGIDYTGSFETWIENGDGLSIAESLVCEWTRSARSQCPADSSGAGLAGGWEERHSNAPHVQRQ